MRRTALFALLLFDSQVLEARNAYAWRSVGGTFSTHSALARRALDLIDASEYPDIVRFQAIPQNSIEGIDLWVTEPGVVADRSRLQEPYCAISRFRG